MATVEQIARVLAWRKHLATKRSARNARKSSFDAGWDAALAWQAEQIAALDGATSTEWGVRDPDHRASVITCRSKNEARDLAKPDEHYPEGWPMVSRQVTEWRAAE